MSMNLYGMTAETIICIQEITKWKTGKTCLQMIQCFNDHVEGSSDYIHLLIPTQCKCCNPNANFLSISQRSCLHLSWMFKLKIIQNSFFMKEGLTIGQLEKSPQILIETSFPFHLLLPLAKFQHWLCIFSCCSNANVFPSAFQSLLKNCDYQLRHLPSYSMKCDH